MTPSLFPLPMKAAESSVRPEDGISCEVPSKPANSPVETPLPFGFLQDFQKFNSSDALSGLLRRASWFGAKPLDSETVPEAEPVQGCPAPTLLLGSLPPFGDVRIGTSASNYFTISNPTGCSVNYSVSGGGYGFSISAPGTTIPAQGSVSVYVTFSPNAEQYYSGTANVNVSGSGTGGAVSFSGHGVR